MNDTACGLKATGSIVLKPLAIKHGNRVLSGTGVDRVLVSLLDFKSYQPEF